MVWSCAHKCYRGYSINTRILEYVHVVRHTIMRNTKFATATRTEINKPSSVHVRVCVCVVQCVPVVPGIRCSLLLQQLQLL